MMEKKEVPIKPAGKSAQQFSGFGFLTFVGQQLSGPSGAIIASVIMALMPLMTTCVNWAMNKSKPKLSTFISIFIALSGARDKGKKQVNRQNDHS